jgi:hypothetical protein
VVSRGAAGPDLLETAPWRSASSLFFGLDLYVFATLREIFGAVWT